MPRGSPKKPVSLRLDPELIEQVRDKTNNLTKAVEDALRDWLKEGGRGAKS
jgi:uncharacterized protein (DUF4415 family)